MRAKSGFSLLELLIVMSIIGILAMIGIPRYTNYVVKARQSEAKVGLNAIYQGETAFHLEHGTYTASLSAIGYSPMGHVRFNIGFGTVTAAPTASFIATNKNNITSTWALCSGEYGGGSSSDCWIPKPVPNIHVLTSTYANQNSFYAVALGFESSMLSHNQMYKFLPIYALVSESAYAITVPSIPAPELPTLPTPSESDRMADQWGIGEKKTITHSKFIGTPYTYNLKVDDDSN